MVPSCANTDQGDDGLLNPIRNGAASITLGSGDFRNQMREANELGEARLWADVLRFTEDFLGIPRGSVRVPKMPPEFTMSKSGRL